MYKPISITNFIGQKPIIYDLAVNYSAIERNTSLGHTLLTGPPGLGKTTLAKVIAKDLGNHFIFSTGTNLNKKSDIEAILFNLGLRDVWFIDEIHAFKKYQELLYSPMQDFHYEGRPLQRFTLIGATTTAGTLSKPLLDRFINIYEFQLYTVKELMEILWFVGEELKFGENVCKFLAERSKGIPRLAINLATKVSNQAVFDGSTIEEACIKVTKRLEIDNLGLNPTDRKILKFLLTHRAFDLHTAIGEEVLSMGLNIDEKDLVYIHESWLIYIGFIMRTPRGRIITDLGIKYVNSFK